jgi:type I restriction enzyme S subunit
MEVKPGYKQTEVGVIPEEWQCTRMSEIAKLESGHTPSKRQPSYWGGSIPWVSLFDTEGLQGREIFETAKMVTDEGLKNSSARLLPKGTVVFSRTATVGKTSVMGRDMATSQDFANYICGPKLHNHFLVYLFRSMGRTWKGLMAGSIHNTIYMPVFKALQIVLPPLPEQRAIAEALSDVDGLLGGLDRLIAKKRDLKQAAMQQLLTGQTRLPGFHGEWEVKRLGDVAKIQRGASPRPIDSPVWFDDSSPVGWVRISDVTRAGMFLLETTQRLSPLGVKHSRPVATGSLIMSICATVGRPIITQIDVCIHDGFVVFDNLEADQRFLYYVLKWIEPDWSKHGQTGSQMNLNTGLINGTRISLPPAAEQTAIAEVLSEMDGELGKLEERREKTRALKQAMMQELLTGRTRLI